jgi:UDP-N-acetylmuramoyl-tripeptide--D-alanyl-D-alanine ligase
MARHARTLAPDVVVVTGIGSEHGRSFPTREDTRAEKVRMVRALGPRGVAVLNADDPHVRWMATQTAARIVTFGFDPPSDVRATEVTLDWPRGTRFELHAAGERRAVHVRLIGRPMVRGILAAIAVGLVEGEPLDAILSRLARLEPTPERLQPVLLPGGGMLLRDDFKSPYESIESALDTLGEIPAARRIVVLGDVTEPGARPRAAYRRLGERIAEVASEAILVGGDSTQSYAAGAKARGLGADRLQRVGPGFQKVVSALAGRLGPGDVVLIKGRNDQRLGRIALALAGRPVRCEIRRCGAVWTACDRCEMLERGWAGRRPIV